MPPTLADVNFWNLAFTAFGVLLVWAAWGSDGLSFRYLRARLKSIELTPTSLLVVEVIATLLSGVILATTLVQPETPQQAIAAGMGWTSLVARPSNGSF